MISIRGKAQLLALITLVASLTVPSFAAAENLAESSAYVTKVYPGEPYTRIEFTSPTSAFAAMSRLIEDGFVVAQLGVHGDVHGSVVVGSSAERASATYERWFVSRIAGQDPVVTYAIVSSGGREYGITSLDPPRTSQALTTDFSTNGIVVQRDMRELRARQLLSSPLPDAGEVERDDGIVGQVEWGSTNAVVYAYQFLDPGATEEFAQVSGFHNFKPDM